MAFEHTVDIGTSSRGLLAPVDTDALVAMTAARWARARTWIRQAACGLRGHDRLLHGQEGRVCLKCWYCGHESPGWSTDGQRPILRYVGDPERHRVGRVAH